MKKVFRVLAYFILIVLVLFACLAIYIGFFYEESKDIKRVYNFKTRPAQNNLVRTSIVDSSITNVIAKYTRRIANDNIVSIGLINADSIYFYGLKRQNNELVYQDNKNEIFLLASITKLFTSVLLTNLYLNDTIKPTTTIDKLTGYPLKNDLKISIGSLANHTSGLKRDPFKDFSDHDFRSIDFFLKEEITIDDKQKGKFNYSNLGFNILGEVISKYEKGGYHHLVNEQIFSKLNMYETFLLDDNLLHYLAPSFDASGTQISPEGTLSYYSSAACIASNVKDMSKFIQANIKTDDPKLILAHKETCIIDSIYSMGVGWRIINVSPSIKLYTHGGAWANSSTAVIFNKNTKSGVVILSTFPLHEINIDMEDFAARLLLKWIERQMVLNINSKN